MTVDGMTMREIGRHAIRLSLARVAFERFCLQGFARVTFDELASSAGVSRSTFLRHFRTKEDAVLFVFDLVGDTMSSVLSSGGDLRAGLIQAADQLQADTPELLAVLDLVGSTPELSSGLFSKQAVWLDAALPDALASSPDEDPVATEAQLASAFACFGVALRRWSAGGGKEELTVVLGRAVAPLL